MRGPAWLVTGAALALAGLFLLRAAQARSNTARASLIVLGWALLLGAPFAFAMSAGGDRGVAIALAVISLFAYALIGAGLRVRARAKLKSETSDALDPTPRPARALRAFWRFCAAGPLAGLASLAIALAVALQFGGPLADRMAVGAITQPIVWGALMAWAMADPRLVRVTLTLAVIALASAAWASAPLLAGAAR